MMVLPKTLPVSLRRAADWLPGLAVGSGQGLGLRIRGLREEGVWTPASQGKGAVPMRSMTPAKVCNWEGFIITKWP